MATQIAFKNMAGWEGVGEEEEEREIPQYEVFEQANRIAQWQQAQCLYAKAYTGCMDTVLFLMLSLVHFLPETGHGSHGNDLKLPLFH